MSVDDRIEDLLVQWEVARLEGNAPTVAELCKNDPELVGEVEQRVAVLHDLSWTLDPFGLVDHSDEVSDQASLDIDAAITDVTVTEFVETLSDSGILNDSQLSQLQGILQTDDRTVQTFAKSLVEQNLITPYQAKVILDRGDSPLLLDRYIILDSIGAGGMGIVFKALQRSLERVVAVKVLPKHALDSPEKVERFQREIRTAAKLSHPNVVQAFDAHESNGVYFLAMEYVDGCDLAALVDQHGPLPVPEAVDIIHQAAAGLGSAHDLRIVHRDVKPANVLLGDDGVAKVLDLGLARTRELVQSTSTNDLTRDGLAMGTVNFMSPEQAFDAKTADERSDIYSLGCTLYYLLHGKPPFERENPIQTVVAHREEPAPKLAAGRTDVSADLESVFQRMVAKDPADRPASMEEVRSLLLSDGSPSQAANQTLSRPNPKLAKQTGLSKTNKLAWIFPLITLLVVGLTIAGIIAAMNSKGNDPRRLAESVLRDDAVMLTLRTEEFEESDVDFASDLPDGEFEITGATLYLDDGENLNSISKLSQIETLSIFSVADAEAITVDLRGLENYPHVTGLYLDQCVLDEYAIAQIARCKKLTMLNISHCNITDGSSLKQLAALPALRDLTLERTSVEDSDLDWLENCESIELLDLGNTRVTGLILSKLAKLPKLEILFMTGLDIVDVEPLTAMDQLTSLSLDATNFSDKDVAILMKLENLDSLDVSHSKLSPIGVRSICKIPSLKYLTVRGLVDIDSVMEEIAAVPNLVELDARHSDLTDAGLQKLESAKGLESLGVEGTEVTDAALDRLLRVLPACTVLAENDLIESIFELDAK